MTRYPLIALGLVLLVAACSGGAAPPTGRGIEGRTFLSTSVTEAGVEWPLVPGTRIRLDFASAGNLGASAGCNSIGGSFSIQDGILRFEGGGMTEMGCDPARHAQDDWLARFLAARPTIGLAGDELTLATAETVVHLLDREVAEPDRPLVGPVWTVETVLTGDVAAAFPGPVASLQFAQDGAVAVNSGCNQGKAVVTEAEDGTLSFSELALTRRGCDGPAAALERAILEVLAAPSLSWSIDADALTLQAGPNGLILRGR